MTPRKLAIVGATIIDGTGGAPIDDGVIVVEGERIRLVGGSSTPVPPDAERIEARGRFVMPGMMDANVHLFFPVHPEGLIRHEGAYEPVMAEAAQVALKGGLTTVFDTWGPREALTHVRDRIDGGEIVGSRVRFAGNIIGLTGPTSADFFPQSRAVLSKPIADEVDARWEQGVGAELLWMTAAEVRARVQAYVASGSQNFLKYASSGHANIQFICFSEKVQRAIVEVGHEAGLTVQAHTTSPESLRMAIEAGCDILQHGDITGLAPMPEETLATIASRRVPCAAIFATRRFLAWNDAHMPEPMRTANRIKDDNDRRLIAARAELLLTTDSGVFPPFSAQNPLLSALATAHDSHYAMGEAHFHWLEAAAELGMKPMDALLAATRNVARAYRVEQDLGTLEPGKVADLLILDKDPLAHPRNYRSIVSVMKEGRIVHDGSA